MGEYIMTLDEGTTSARCIIYDRSGKAISVGQKEFRQIFPHDGWVEHDAMEIYSTQMAVAQEALLKASLTYRDIEDCKYIVVPVQSVDIEHHSSCCI